jgi:exodeoxyribonuclease VII large subunit
VKTVGSRTVWSLEEVTGAIWRRFEDIPPVWVEAEVQNLRSAGGQTYFTLAGGDLMDASMNRIVFERLPARPGEGTLVQAYGRVEFWKQRSQVRMRVERMELAGEGLLRAQVEELRRRLGAEGLLAAARKRPLPALPRRIGLVTSAQGAAKEDFLRALWARFPADVLLVDVPVQGEAAPAAVVRAIRHLDVRADVEVIVVARGGGSLEDLMAFNSEAVCRAVAGATTPVVSAVGHERDVTVCDEVADLRVSTPTAAAQAVVADAAALERGLRDAEETMARELARARGVAAERLAQRTAALGRALRERGTRAGDRVDAAERRLAPALARAAGRAPERLAASEAALTRAARARADQAGRRLERAEALLGLLSPERTVARGYAIVRDAATDGVIGAAAAAAPGQALSIQLRDGRLPAVAGS